MKNHLRNLQSGVAFCLCLVAVRKRIYGLRQTQNAFSRLNEISSIAFSSSIGYLIGENLSLNADIGIKLIAIGVPPNNIRALSPYIGINLRKEFLSKYNTPCFSIFIPFEFTFGKTVKGVSLGIGIGYFISLPKVENK